MFIYTHDSAYDENKINVQLWHGFPLKGLSYMSNYLKEEKKKNLITKSGESWILLYLTPKFIIRWWMHVMGGLMEISMLLLGCQEMTYY